MHNSIIADRSELYRSIREFFFERDVLEVIPPVLGFRTVSDPHIQSFTVASEAGKASYLQTSPEFALKKLLGAGSGPIYSMGPVFRAEEEGSRHRSEFMMLEWYRPGFSLMQLQSEITELLIRIASKFDQSFPIPVRRTYKELFMERYGLNPHNATNQDLSALMSSAFPDLAEHIGSQDAGLRNDYLDSLFSLGIEPDLQSPTFVTEFPATQAALAKTAQKDDEVSLRAELFWHGMELANGYDELTDGNILRGRIDTDNQVRQSRGLANIEPDEALIRAMETMPDCSGVAVGLDRLLMLVLAKNDINDVSILPAE